MQQYRRTIEGRYFYQLPFSITNDEGGYFESMHKLLLRRVLEALSECDCVELKTHEAGNEASLIPPSPLQLAAAI